MLAMIVCEVLDYREICMSNNLGQRSNPLLLILLL